MTGLLALDDTLAGATFSPDNQYRYRLWRIWDAKLPPCLWAMLNPSSAGATKLDQTTENCATFSRLWGFGGFVVVNLFALVSTNPKGLLDVLDPVGPDNDMHIREAAKNAGRIMAGWGRLPRASAASPINKLLAARREYTLDLLRGYGDVYRLGVNKDGSPWHPLYVAHSTQPELHVSRSAT